MGVKLILTQNTWGALSWNFSGQWGDQTDLDLNISGLQFTILFGDTEEFADEVGVEILGHMVTGVK